MAPVSAPHLVCDYSAALRARRQRQVTSDWPRQANLEAPCGTADKALSKSTGAVRHDHWASFVAMTMSAKEEPALQHTK